MENEITNHVTCVENRGGVTETNANPRGTARDAFAGETKHKTGALRKGKFADCACSHHWPPSAPRLGHGVSRSFFTRNASSARWAIGASDSESE